jgi:simple sugar transport system ATP-binding protein
MENISKSFGSIQALRNVSLTIDHSEVVGLIGDNGAGKSTLIKILMGIHKPDQGRIYYYGKEVHFSSAEEARIAGIEPVYQDLALVDSMSIWRNFFLAREEIGKR